MKKKEAKSNICIYMGRLGESLVSEKHKLAHTTATVCYSTTRVISGCVTIRKHVPV